MNMLFAFIFKKDPIEIPTQLSMFSDKREEHN